MLLPGDAPPRRSEWLWCLMPVASALVFHVGTVRAGYVLDDAALERQGASIEDLHPGRLFVESYFSPDRIDPGYRPLTYLTFWIERHVEASARTRHLVNVTLHAAAALLAFLLLRELLGGAAAAPIAAIGAALFAALPIVTDAVARISGRADILAGIATLGAWLVALRNAPKGDGAGERTPGILAAGAITFAGLFTRENTALSVPFLIAATSWLLRRRVPWRTTAACACAILGCIAIRGVILEGRPYILTHTGNPLADEDFLTRALNGLRLLGLYALKIAVPVELSAEYTAFDLPARASTDPLLWLEAAVVLAAIIGVTAFLRRRAPLAALAPLVFFLALAPVANVVLLAGSVFQERAAYLATLAWPIAICSVFQCANLPRKKRAVVIIAGVLLAAYGAKTLSRNERWVRADPLELGSAAKSPARARSMFLAYTELQEKARSAYEKRDLRARALSEVERQRKLDPSGGWAEALEGHVSSQDGKYAEAIEHLTKAERLLASLDPPVIEPLLHQLRGDAYVILGKAAEAYQDLDRHIRILEGEGKHPAATAYSRRGLTLAQQGNLSAALLDFNTAISARQDLAEIWNNRGFCRFKLGDLAGAIEDYNQGLGICRKQGTDYAASGDSVHAFLLRIADVYLAVAQQHLAAKNEESARLAAAEAAKLKSDADRIAALQAPRVQKAESK